MTTAAGVSVLLDTEGGGHLRGLATCGSVWHCPVCQMKIKAERGREVSKVVEAHGRRGAVLVTLTIRHGRGHSLEQMRRKLGKAYRALTSGEPWKRFAEAVGLVGAVRGLEVTHSQANGWHPHLHAVWLLEPGWMEAESVKLKDKRIEGNPYVRLSGSDAKRYRARLPELGNLAAIVKRKGHSAVPVTWDEWLAARWRQVVRRHVGEEHAPDTVNGINLSPCDRGAKYLAKLGLEVSDPGTKTASPRTDDAGRRTPSRTPWQIALSLVDAGDDPSSYMLNLSLWGEYVAAMRGARQLTWSRGLRERYGLRDITDEEIAAEVPRDATVALVIDDEAWKAVAWYRHKGLPAPLLLIESAERHGGRRTLVLLEFLVRAAQEAAAKRKRDQKLEQLGTLALAAEIVEQATETRCDNANPRPGTPTHTPADRRELDLSVSNDRQLEEGSSA